MCKEESERARTKGFFLRGHNTSIGSRTYVSRAMVYPHTQLLSLRRTVASRSPGPSSGGLGGSPAGPNSQTCTHAGMHTCACRCCRNGTLASNTNEQLARKHPQHVTTLTMKKRNENALRKAPHRTEATPDIENPKSKLININHTHPETTNPQNEQQACQSKLGWHMFNNWTSQLPTRLSFARWSVSMPFARNN